MKFSLFCHCPDTGSGQFQLPYCHFVSLWEWFPGSPMELIAPLLKEREREYGIVRRRLAFRITLSLCKTYSNSNNHKFRPISAFCRCSVLDWIWASGFTFSFSSRSNCPLPLSVDSGGSTSTTSKMGESRRRILDSYLNRLSRLTGSLITCYPVLKFLEVRYSFL